LVRRLIWVEE